MAPQHQQTQIVDFQQKINSGELDNRKIEITVQKPSSSGIGMVGGGMMDESSMINLQDMISNMMPKRNKKRNSIIQKACPGFFVTMRRQRLRGK